MDHYRYIGSCVLLHNTTAVLGFITLGVWHEEDSGKVGEGHTNVPTFSNDSARKLSMNEIFPQCKHV